MPHNQSITLDTALKQLITVGQAWQYRIIPEGNRTDLIRFYVSEENNNEEINDELEVLFGKPVSLIASTSQIIDSALTRFYMKGRKEGATDALKLDSDNFVEQLIEEAQNLGCSDIHLESFEEQARVRMRIDGRLVERFVIDKGLYPSIVNKLKIKSNLDIAEKRLPQDGRIFFSKGQEKFDIRVSILPTLHGEKVVLRILGSDASKLDISHLGFSSIDLERYQSAIKKPNGIILISGPTGSGKTTTIYATLKQLNQVNTNILTIEDPIEYTLQGINQVQLKTDIGLDFARALRTFLRQDPDFIMVGEIRDIETAKMAVRAALTGHLVLSTIHTNSAWGTVSRLIEMGVSPYLLASTLNASLAQRLIRALCPHCKQEKTLDKNSLPAHIRKRFPFPDTHHVAVGCEQCHQTGYKGRKAIYEVITVDRRFSRLIKDNKLEIEEELKEYDIKTLEANAFSLFLDGETSLDEVYPYLLNE